ncbi:TlpA family protein disulfide reductase [Paenalcaligenes suwonensis]|uniref:TlpA family protein disulfide reductase n=1 Tax=Paenalcaligenes suwonensis TaxID=1202713 RepID=UPI00140CD2D4|nr:TlpA disulfide reductase family protein [Paenalcaligenes suwonensis]NHC60424.1 TlpA family protein disulfide reductase [Paenalcaligenes suwonensis]
MDRRNFMKGCAAAGLFGTGIPSVWAADATVGDFYQQSFSTLEGESRSMADYLGKPLLVNFWATWCPPCVKEMPDLDALSQEFPDVRFLGVAVDTVGNVNKFLLKTPVSYDILVAGHRGIQIMRDLGNRQGGLPYTMLFDSEGTEQHRVLGQIAKASLAIELASLAG